MVSDDVQYGRKCEKLSGEEVLVHLCDSVEPCLGKKIIKQEKTPCSDRSPFPQLEGNKKLNESLNKVLGEFDYDSRMPGKITISDKQMYEAKAMLKELKEKSKIKIFLTEVHFNPNPGGKPERFLDDIKGADRFWELYRYVGLRVVFKIQGKEDKFYFDVENKKFSTPEALFSKCE